MITNINTPTLLIVQFGPSYTGLTNVGYTLKNFDGSIDQARTQAGVSEVGGGIYQVIITFTKGWFGYIVWDSPSVPTPAFEEINVESVFSFPDRTAAPIKAKRNLGVGPASVPRDIKNLRQQSLDFHKRYGVPVIHKHRWNEIDVLSGRAKWCPLHDHVYGQDRQWDPYCFGTGILGGWDDGTIVFVTISDVPIDTIKIGKAGVLTLQDTPQFTAPWTPTMGDGDLIIKADIAPDNYTVLDIGNRYILSQVSPITIRGHEEQARSSHSEYKINQAAEIDKLPTSHAFYAVPVNFDYSNVPQPIPLYDPDTLAVGTKFASVTATLKVRGKQVNTTFITVPLKVAVAGTNSSTTAILKLAVKPKPSHVFV